MPGRWAVVGRASVLVARALGATCPRNRAPPGRARARRRGADAPCPSRGSACSAALAPPGPAAQSHERGPETRPRARRARVPCARAAPAASGGPLPPGARALFCPGLLLARAAAAALSAGMLYGGHAATIPEDRKK